MKFWVEVMRGIGLGMCGLIFALFCKIFFLLKLNILFPGLGKVMGMPYELFQAYSDDGDVKFSKHSHDANSKAGAAFLDLMFLPYNIYRGDTLSIGESEFDRERLKLWFTVGWVAPLLLVVLIFIFG